MILVVDDDQISAQVALLYLKSKGLECTIVDSGQRCLNFLSEQDKPEAVLLDINMPGLSGFQTLQKIRETFEPIELPVLMLTASDDQESITKALQMGASDYIVKPIKTEVALARIRTQLSLVGYYEKSLLAKELEAVRSMIVTYNHEINNPLFVVAGSLKLFRQTEDPKFLDRIEKGVGRITEVVKNIRTLATKAPESERYSEKSKKFRISS